MPDDLPNKELPELSDRELLAAIDTRAAALEYALKFGQATGIDNLIQNAKKIEAYLTGEDKEARS